MDYWRPCGGVGSRPLERIPHAAFPARESRGRIGRCIEYSNATYNSYRYVLVSKSALRLREVVSGPVRSVYECARLTSYSLVMGLSFTYKVRAAVAESAGVVKHAFAQA